MSELDSNILSEKLKAAKPATPPATTESDTQPRNETVSTVDTPADPAGTAAPDASATKKQESGTDTKTPETAKPEAKDQGEPETGDDVNEIQDIFKDLGFPNFGNTKRESKEQPTTSAQTAQGDWFEAAKKELGIDSMTKEEWLAKQKSPQPSSKPLPGIPEEVHELLEKGLISISEVAAAGPLVDISKIPNEDLLRDHFLGLDMTPEEADEAIEEMSNTQRIIEAAKIRKEIKATRESAFSKLKLQSEQRAKQEAEMKAQAMQGTIQAIESTTKAVVEALSKQTVEVAGVKMPPEEIAEIAKIVANPSELRKLVFSENDDPFEMGKRVWVLKNFDQISQKAIAAAKHHERKTLIEKAAGFNPGTQSTPVVSNSSEPDKRTSAQKLRDAIRQPKK